MGPAGLYRLTRRFAFSQRPSFRCFQEWRICRKTSEKLVDARLFSCKSQMSRSMSSNNPENNIIWIDMEMTGLDLESDRILEAACIVTDGNIKIIAEGPNLVIHQPLDVLQKMDEWNLTHHTESGLFKASLKSEVSIEQAENELLNFVQQYTPKGKCPLAGNTVYMDKRFLLKHMPRFCDHLHYRILDVSSIKILSKCWYNLDPPKKKLKHRALDDIKESIQELIYYRNSIFKPTDRLASASNQS